MADTIVSPLTLEPAFYTVAIFAVIITKIPKSGLGGYRLNGYLGLSKELAPR